MLNRLKSLFIIEDETGKNTAENEAAIEKPVGSSQNDTPVVASREGKINSKFTNVLLSAMDNQNLDGFDYLEFKQAMQNLSKMPMDEATRYQSAYAMARTMGATPQQLLDTAAHYVQILQQEEQKFEQALANQRDKQIASKKEELSALHQFIKDKAVRIQQLNQEIEAHQLKTEALQKDVEEASVKVENTKNDFMASFSMIVNQIHKDIENMKKYLK